MMTPRELFETFIALSSYSNRSKTTENLVDNPLGEGVLGRLYGGSITVIKLGNGTKIQLPQSLVDVFIEFSKEHRDTVLSINRIKKGDTISKFIILITRFLVYFNRKSPQANEILGEICELGTREFRDWCVSQFGLKIHPISFNSIDNSLYI